MHRLKSKGRSLGKFQVEQSQIASGQVCTTSSQAGKHSQNKHGWKEVATSVSFKIDFGVPFQLCTMYPNMLFFLGRSAYYKILILAGKKKE